MVQQSQRREQWEKTKKRRQPERKLVAVEMLFFFSAFLLISLKERVDLVGLLLAFLVPALIFVATIWMPKLFPADKLLMAIVNFLCALGVLILYSTDGGAGTDRGFQQALYYGLGLVAMLVCILLVRYVRLHEIGEDRYGELKRSLACSYIMLLLNFFFSGAVLMVVYQNKGYEYHGVMISVMAIYTFYTSTHTIIDLIKYRRFESPVMSTAKGISMAAALVSMLNLETAMFAEFGADMAKEDQRLMIMLTGAGISATVIAMAVYMIVHCTKQIKKMRCRENG